MGNPSRGVWRLFLLFLGCLMVSAAPAQSFSVSRLGADPPAAQVIAGEADARFVASATPVIIEPMPIQSWWRIRANVPVDRANAPQLVLQSPYLNAVEAWLPGEAMPVRRTMIGRDADLDFSTRALVFDLPQGLRQGDTVYLRVDARSPQPMRASIEPLARVHRDDLRHVAWRIATLATMVVLAILALGFWLGVGERSYAYLLLTLASQVLYLVSVGGEVRALPWLAEVIGGDVRIGRLFAALSMIASLVFVSFYLDLARQQPRFMRAINGFTIAMLMFLLVSLVSGASWIALVANGVVLAAILTMIAACVIGSLRGQRAAHFLLLSWAPLFVLTALRVGETLGAWTNPEWVGYAFPAAFAMAGLLLTIGLADSMQQLRRERDHASRLARQDALTGALSRPATDERLLAAVVDAHRSGAPLSVVFFDIDHFKRINDQFGHRAGDECLRIISMRTRNRLRRYDQFGRYGGDEMLVILPNTNLAVANGVAENLRSAVNCRPLSIDGQLLDITLSLGVAQLAPDESAGKMLERADAALYVSKAAGRDRVTEHSPGTITAEMRAYVPR